jgi:hypothetical protein
MLDGSAAKPGPPRGGYRYKGHLMEVELSGEFEVRRDAVAELVRAVLARFALNEAAPRFGTRIDVRRWWRLGQEDFAGLQRDAWVMPKDLPILGWLDGFPEIAAVRQAYAADPVLRDRVDTMLGGPVQPVRNELLLDFGATRHRAARERHSVVSVRSGGIRA